MAARTTDSDVLVRIKRTVLAGHYAITACPSCGSKKIKAVRRNSTRKFERCEYTVPNLEYYECPDCGEKVYDREAMRQIEAHSPAFERLRARRKSARTLRSATSSRP